jgi:cysteine-rich repeat protein
MGGGPLSSRATVAREQSLIRTHRESHRPRFVVASLSFLLWSHWLAGAALAGGPVMLAGHDADDHGFAAVYADLFDSIYANVGNGGSGILAIGADPGSVAGNWITSVGNQMAVPQTVTFVNDAAITTQPLAGFAIIHVPSTTHDTAGGISESAELPLLVARANEIVEFIAAGGGLFGLTQGEDVDDPYAYLGPFAELETIGLPASGDCDGGAGSQLYDNVTATPLGASLGITNTNIDGCCWHNAFSVYPDFLNILAIANEPLCTFPAPIDGLPAVIGCFACQIPGQLGLAPAQAFNLPDSSHALTATLLQAVAPNAPISGVDVTFSVITGPNFGDGGVDTTDALGEAEFSYVGDGGIGVDRIEATAVDPATSEILFSNVALKFWDEDCNANSVPDSCDVDCDAFGDDCMLYPGCGASADGNSTGIPDECEGCAIVGPCDDGDACTENDHCDGFTCAGTPLDCSNLDGTCTFGECNAGTGQCEALPINEGGLCNDANPCTHTDVCVAGTCAGAAIDCSFLDSQCTAGICNAITGECEQFDANEGQPCDDGNGCNSNDICITGVCSSCGNGSTDGGCGETCDPPVAGICDPTCQSVVCGNGIIQSGEECDDGNASSGDGCSSSCVFEDKLCIEGTQPSVARQAKRVAFVSDFDYVGQNADGNEEIFYFDRKRMSKAIKKKVKKEGIDPVTAKNDLIATRANEFFRQLTDTLPPVANELPSLNGSGRVVAFVSNGDLEPSNPGNPDGNREIYRIDVKLMLRGDATASEQITDSPPGVSNLNPNLRAFRGALLAFDSNGDLAPGQCVGGTFDLAGCTTNEDCSAGACGNPEGNREVFIHLQDIFASSGINLRQLTAAPSGTSFVGQNANYAEKSTVITTTADLLGLNPERNSEIYRVASAATTLVPVTQSTTGEHGEAAQAVRGRMAFTSNGDITGANADSNREVFVWQATAAPPYLQIGTSMGCLNAAPSMDNRGRFVAFQSTCDRIASLGNPDQSIYVWDNGKQKLLPLVVRGEQSAASARPQAAKAMSVLTYESNIGNPTDPAICFLNVRQFLKTLAKQP